MISAMAFSDVTKQNGRVSAGTLHREVLGEIMSLFINSKNGEGEAYSTIVLYSRDHKGFTFI